ncbi:MAG: hypothetical protein R3C61_09445 [Bacteroidia bacterium]
MFARSPWFNRNDRLIRLIEYLIRFAPDYDKANWDNAFIFTLLYGEQAPFQEQQVYDHFSFLNRLLENFLVQRALEEDTNEHQRFLLHALAGRGLENHFNHHYRKIQKSWEKMPFGGTDLFLTQYRIRQEAVLLFGQQQKREADAHLPDLFFSLDIAYLTARLRFTCEWLNRANILHTEPAEKIMAPLSALLDVASPEFDHYSVVKRIFLCFSDSHRSRA